MALSHAISGQAIDLRPLGADFSTAQTVALVKSQDIELVRMVLPEGKTVPPHTVPGDFTLLCVEGEIEVAYGEGNVTVLKPCQLLYLAGGVPYGFAARQDSSALLTISLRR
ncbi:MAG: hypothetical protein RLY71_3203 [Pseudomonadota bacterium]|jgi:quercetin dioxygenase-like cupin family protein